MTEYIMTKETHDRRETFERLNRMKNHFREKKDVLTKTWNSLSVEEIKFFPAIGCRVQETSWILHEIESIEKLLEDESE